MMLSRTGRDRDPPLGRCHTGEGRRAPWGCATGVPYRGTACPPPPPPPHVYGLSSFSLCHPCVYYPVPIHVSGLSAPLPLATLYELPRANSYVWIVSLLPLAPL